MEPMNQLLDVFDKQAASVKDQLTSLLVTVSDGRVPDKMIMNNFNSDMEILVSEYEKIKSKAQSLIDASEMPENGSKASDYVDAVNKSRSRMVKLQLGKAEAVLKRFLKVKSLIVEYENAISPFKTKATEVLNEISEDNIDNYISETEAPELFLNALDTEDLTGKEGFPILSEISKYYPPQVQWGLTGKKFYIDENVCEKDEECPEEKITAEEHKKEPLKSVESDIRNNQRDNLQKTDANDAEKEIETASPAENKTKNNKPGEMQPENGEQPQNEIDSTVGDKDDILSNYLKATNSPKNCQPSASSFKKDIITLSKTFSDVRSILPYFSNFGILSREQIYRISICVDFCDESDSDRARIDATLNELVRKGYLACFKYNEDNLSEDVFCLSPYCYGCLNKQTVYQMKDFWGVSFGDVKVVSSGNMERKVVEKYVRSNKRLADYLYVSKGLAEPDDYKKIKGSIRWYEDYLLIGVLESGDLYPCCVYDPKYYVEDNDEAFVLVVGKDEFDEDELLLDKSKIFVCDNQAIRVIDDSTKIDSEEDNGDEDSVESGLEQEVDSELESEEERKVDSIVDITQISEEKIALKNDSEIEVDNKEVSVKSLIEKDSTPTDVEFCTVMNLLLNRDYTTKEQLTSVITQTVVFAKAVGDVASMKESSSCYPESHKLSAQIRLATHLMLNECSYTSECLTSAFIDPFVEDPALMLSAYLLAMLVPGMAYDYNLMSQTEQFFSQYEDFFGKFDVFKPLFNTLMSVCGVAPTGFSPALVSLLGDDAEKNKYINKLCISANECLILKSPKTRMKTLPSLYSKCFGKGSDFYESMSIISKNDKNSVEIVEVVLNEFSVVQNGGERSISSEKIEEKLNQAWYDVNPKNKYKLEYDAKDQAMRQFTTRLEIMQDWVQVVKNMDNLEGNISRLKQIKNEIFKTIQEIQGQPAWKKEKNANVLIWSLSYIQQYLNGQVSKLKIYSDFVYTGIISVDNDGVPIIDNSLASVKYYEPWRLVLKHVAAVKKTPYDLKEEILGGSPDVDNGDDGLKDNLHQLQMLGKLVPDDSEDYVISDSQVKDAKESADESGTRFLEKLELAYTYNQINETEKENLLGIVNLYRPVFYELNDFACWRRFLGALEKQITTYANERKLQLRNKLDEKIKNNPQSSLLKEADRLLEEDMNFAVTEEYLNRFDARETELDNDEVIHDFDYFNDFLNPSNFEPLIQVCRRNSGKVLGSFGWDYIAKNIPDNWTSRQKDDSRNLVTSWPKKFGMTLPSTIVMLFTSLGFEVEQAVKECNNDSRKTVEVFKIFVKRTARSKADYLHPIAAFGTQMRSPINVILLFGNHTEKQLVDTVSSLELGGISIVLLDRAVDVANRRLIGELFHNQKSGQNRFLLIDQVLLLYLAMHQITERLPAMLRCTLPYTTYQPFVRDGGSTADEMFCGRIQELTTIMDPNGACVVYGGRQLGKTALLERAESRCSKPSVKEFAVYISIVRLKSEKEVVDAIVTAINNKVEGKIQISQCETLKDLCSVLGKMFNRKQISSMLLLIDEVDDFLASIADVAYQPIQPLVDLKRETKNSFKFVIAGLHNVCRAKNATKENGIFGQLGTPLCIKPLSPRDALQLISKPLCYLGFQIDRYPHLETILTNTNYYPGILQFFGYMLVETLTSHYSKYYSATNGNPPFTLQDEQLGAVMNSSDLNKSIKEKFRLSLELDSRYFMIARCITLLYHYYEDDRKSGTWKGYPIDEIIHAAEGYKIHCLENLSKNDYIRLLDEMVEMGILAKPDDEQNLYRLRRNSFVDIIGENVDTLEEEIENNNREDAV